MSSISLLMYLNEADCCTKLQLIILALQQFEKCILGEKKEVIADGTTNHK